MQDLQVENIKNYLSELLNSHPVSTDSIEGWVIIFLIAFIIWNIYRKALRFVIWSLSVILMIQIGYFLSLTGLNNIIPLSSLFKFDVLTAIAQTCVGTPFCEFLLYINASIRYICTQLWYTLCNFKLSL